MYKTLLLIAFYLFINSESWVKAQDYAVLDSFQNQLAISHSEEQKAFWNVEMSTFYKRFNIDSAQHFAEISIGHARKSADDYTMANSLNALGNIYTSKGQLGYSLTIFLEALDYASKANDNNKIARINNNIGIVYYNQGKLDKALDHFQTTANILIASGDTLGAIFAFNNIAGIYNDQNKQAESLAYFERGYNLSVQIEHELAQSVLLTGVATVNAALGDYDLALDLHLEALEIKRNMGNKSSMIHSLDAISEIFYVQGKYRESLRYLEEIAVITMELGKHDHLQECYTDMAKTYRELGDYRSAYDYSVSSKQLEDSLALIAEEETIAEIQGKYDKAQDQKKIQLLEKDKQLHQAESERKGLWNFVLIGGGLLVLAVALLIYTRLRTSRRQNQIIKDQKRIVDLKNKEVHDSITYAKRIQTAMLGAESKDVMDLPEHFILFKPKDIVSGDFYWSVKKKEHFYLAAVDCTGHGVPGAFLTLLGSAFLNEIVNRDADISPAAILDLLRDRIMEELGQTSEESSSKDGMDMSLIKVNINNMTAEWAGANNPLWIIRNGGSEVEEIKADKEHIGYGYKMTPFTNHEINFHKGDTFYLFSDGYVDQFGGIDTHGKQKKFKASKLKEILLNQSSSSLNEQHDILVQEFEKWKGDIEQIDDVCIIGMRL